MAFLTSRGAFVAIMGILLMSIGLSVMGIRTAQTMLPMLFSENGFQDLFNQNQGSSSGGGNQAQPTAGVGGQNNATTTTDPVTNLINGLLEFASVPESVVDYLMFLGIVMTLAAVVGLPMFRWNANPAVIRVSRKVDKEKTFAGEFVYVEVFIENTSRRRLDFVEIYDAIPDTFELALGENYILTEIGPRQTRKFSYVVRVSTRGVYKIGPTKIILRDKLGFYFEEDTREFYTEILVYPSYEDIRRMESLSKKRQLGKQFGMHKTRQKGMGDDFHSLRRYYPGDEFKKIDWKAFARTNNLMVREFEAEKNIRMIVFLNHSGSMGGGIPNNTKLDFAIRATMLTFHMALERQDLFGFVSYADRVTSFIQPTAGKKNMFFQLLEILALIEPQPGAADPLAAVDYVMRRVPHASFYVFLTDLERDLTNSFTKAVERARAAKNRVTVIAPFGPLFEAKLSDMTVTERAIAEAIAEEYLVYRRQLEERLRRLDVEIINVGPDDMLPTVIKQYMKAKAQGVAAV